jgi:hypothetical protein
MRRLGTGSPRSPGSSSRRASSSMSRVASRRSGTTMPASATGRRRSSSPPWRCWRAGRRSLGTPGPRPALREDMRRELRGASVHLLSAIRNRRSGCGDRLRRSPRRVRRQVPAHHQRGGRLEQIGRSGRWPLRHPSQARVGRVTVEAHGPPIHTRQLRHSRWGRCARVVASGPGRCRCGARVPILLR